MNPAKELRTLEEQQAVILTISAFNDCPYCTAAHTKAAQGAGLPQEEIEALLEGGLPGDARLKTLARATRRLLSKRGWLSEDNVAEFAAEGVYKTQLTEILAFISLKTLSNFFNHYNQTEIDPQFQ